MTKRILLASVFAAVIAVPASADNWTGFYVGVHAGGAFGDTDWTNVSNASTPFLDFNPTQEIGQSVDGVLGGAQLGYNFQMTNWLFGIELTGAGLDYDETTENPFDNDVTGEYVTSEVDWLATAAARLGWTFSDSLLYVKGGYAGANVQTSHVDASGANQNSYSTDETHSGWMAGAGLEHQIGDNVSLGLEYNYIDLGNQDHTGVDTVSPGQLVVNDIDVQMHTVTARLNWHFNPF